MLGLHGTSTPGKEWSNCKQRPSGTPGKFLELPFMVEEFRRFPNRNHSIANGVNGDVLIHDSAIHSFCSMLHV